MASKLQKMNEWRSWLKSQGHPIKRGESYEQMRSRVKRLGGAVGGRPSSSSSGDDVDGAMMALSQRRQSWRWPLW